MLRRSILAAVCLTAFSASADAHPGRFFTNVRGLAIAEDLGTDVPPVAAGAAFPIHDSVASWGGTARYVTPGGLTSGTCTLVTACTVTQAISAAVTGDTLVFRGAPTVSEYDSDGQVGYGEVWDGTTWNGQLSIASKSLKFVAYPEETPTLDGARAATVFTTEGSYKYTSYIERLCSSASGINFCTGQNMNNIVGSLVDQAWIDGTQIQQVATKAEVLTCLPTVGVTGACFWVDTVNNRMYFKLTIVNAASEVAVSDRGRFIDISAPNVTIAGLKIKRYSQTQSKGGVINFNAAADNCTIRELEIDDTPSLALGLFGNGNDLIDTCSIDGFTNFRFQWVGINPSLGKDITMNRVLISNGDQWNEFGGSPQSGAIKFSRVYRSTIDHSEIVNNKSQGIWWDQSNYEMVLINSILDNNGVSENETGVFCEISDGFIMANNYIRSNVKNPVKLSACTRARLWNNTIVGGFDSVWITADPRSQVGCAAADVFKWITGPTNTSGGGRTFERICTTSTGSDRWLVPSPARPATQTWLPAVEEFKNNVIAYPTGNSPFCGTNKFNVCITAFNSNPATSITVTNPTPPPATISKATGYPGDTPINTIIHNAAILGSPATAWDCQVYAPGTGLAIGTQSTDYATAALWNTYAAGSPILLSGVDANSITDNTKVLATGDTTGLTQSNACAIPADIAALIGVATNAKHYGALLH